MSFYSYFWLAFLQPLNFQAQHRPPVSDRQTPALTTALPPPQESFNGSGTVDKLVPGVVPLSLLDAIDRGSSTIWVYFFPSSRQPSRGHNIAAS